VPGADACPYYSASFCASQAECASVNTTPGQSLTCITGLRCGGWRLEGNYRLLRVCDALLKNSLTRNVLTSSTLVPILMTGFSIQGKKMGFRFKTTATVKTRRNMPKNTAFMIVTASPISNWKGQSGTNRTALSSRSFLAGSSGARLSLTRYAYPEKRKSRMDKRMYPLKQAIMSTVNISPSTFLNYIVW
jgi:hypothetical protein